VSLAVFFSLLLGVLQNFFGCGGGWGLWGFCWGFLINWVVGVVFFVVKVW
jgi:hypothetical protein